jgi:hypothetical protein
MSENDKCIENLFLTYEFHAIDAYQHDQYYFKPGNETAKDRLNQFFKDNCEKEFKFFYRKNEDLFIKVNTNTSMIFSTWSLRKVNHF